MTIDALTGCFMVDVFFHGRGDWFIKTSTGIRPLTSKVSLCSDEHLKYLESNKVNIVYTNVSLRDCQSFSSVFQLNPEDEKVYLLTKSKKILKKRLRKLLPSRHPGSSFLEYVKMGLLSINDINNCYFMIQTSNKYSHEKSAIKVKFKLKILDSNNTGIINDTYKPVEEADHEPKNIPDGQLEKLKSLNNFINDFSISRKKIDPEFNPLFMKCNNNDLLIALQKWAKNRDKETQRLWGIKELGNSDIWYLKERKEICMTLPRGKQSKREEDYFKIVKF